MNIALPIRRLAAAALTAVLCSPSMAQTTSMVVPFQAGGPSDFTARTILPELSKLAGGTIIVENVPGAGGALAAQKVLHAPADGSSMLFASPIELITTPLAFASARHKPEDFRPVALLVSAPMIMVSRRDLPFNTVDELVEAYRNPTAKELSYGSVGEGSILHLPGVRFAQETGLKMLHVPYKGAAAVVADLMGGQIDIAFVPMTANVPALIKEGKIKALGIAAKQPHFLLPNVPTLSSTKALDDFEFDAWIGVFVARQTSDAVVNRLSKHFYQALESQAVRNAYEGTGSVALKSMSVADLERLYVAETARYQAMVRAANVQRK